MQKNSLKSNDHYLQCKILYKNRIPYSSFGCIIQNCTQVTLSYEMNSFLLIVVQQIKVSLCHTFQKYYHHFSISQIKYVFIFKLEVSDFNRPCLSPILKVGKVIEKFQLSASDFNRFVYRFDICRNQLAKHLIRKARVQTLELGIQNIKLVFTF